MDLLERPFIRNCTNVRSLHELRAALQHVENKPNLEWELRSSYLRQIRQELTILQDKEVLQRALLVTTRFAVDAGCVLEWGHKEGEREGTNFNLFLAGI